MWRNKRGFLKNLILNLDFIFFRQWVIIFKVSRGLLQSSDLQIQNCEIRTLPVNIFEKQFFCSVCAKKLQGENFWYCLVVKTIQLFQFCHFFCLSGSHLTAATINSSKMGRKKIQISRITDERNRQVRKTSLDYPVLYKIH